MKVVNVCQLAGNSDSVNWIVFVRFVSVLKEKLKLVPFVIGFRRMTGWDGAASRTGGEENAQTERPRRTCANWNSPVNTFDNTLADCFSGDFCKSLMKWCPGQDSNLGPID